MELQPSRCRCRVRRRPDDARALASHMPRATGKFKYLPRMLMFETGTKFPPGSSCRGPPPSQAPAPPKGAPHKVRLRVVWQSRRRPSYRPRHSPPALTKLDIEASTAHTMRRCAPFCMLLLAGAAWSVAGSALEPGDGVGSPPATPTLRRRLSLGEGEKVAFGLTGALVGLMVLACGIIFFCRVRQDRLRSRATPAQFPLPPAPGARGEAAATPPHNPQHSTLANSRTPLLSADSTGQLGSASPPSTALPPPHPGPAAPAAQAAAESAAPPVSEPGEGDAVGARALHVAPPSAPAAGGSPALAAGYRFSSSSLGDPAPVTGRAASSEAPHPPAITLGGGRGGDGDGSPDVAPPSPQGAAGEPPPASPEPKARGASVTFRGGPLVLEEGGGDAGEGGPVAASAGKLRGPGDDVDDDAWYLHRRRDTTYEGEEEEEGGEGGGARGPARANRRSNSRVSSDELALSGSAAATATAKAAAAQAAAERGKRMAAEAAASDDSSDTDTLSGESGGGGGSDSEEGAAAP